MGHDLRRLFAKFEELTRDVVSEIDRADGAAARAALESFLAFEPHHDASRYPVGTDGKRFHRADRVDLNELHRTARAVSTMLSAAYDQADAFLEAMPEEGDFP